MILLSIWKSLLAAGILSRIHDKTIEEREPLPSLKPIHEAECPKFIPTYRSRNLVYLTGLSRSFLTRSG
jgi:hypothetical protein